MADTTKARFAAVTANAIPENQVATIYVRCDSVTVESNNAISRSE
jgi:hypothetical protein